MTHGEYIQAIGYISAELAARADAWNGNAPEWFPEPPEWLEIADRALRETGDGSVPRRPEPGPGVDKQCPTCDPQYSHGAWLARIGKACGVCGRVPTAVPPWVDKQELTDPASENAAGTDLPAVPQGQVGDADARAGQRWTLYECQICRRVGMSPACCASPYEPARVPVEVMPVSEHEAALAEKDREIERLLRMGEGYGSLLKSANADVAAFAARVTELEAERERIAAAIIPAGADTTFLALAVEDLANCSAHEAARVTELTEALRDMTGVLDAVSMTMSEVDEITLYEARRRARAVLDPQQDNERGSE